MIGWTEEKWIEVFDRWLERTAKYEKALRTIAEFKIQGLRSPTAVIALTALEDE